MEQVTDLQQRSDRGDKDAPFQLGVLYLTGRVVSQDPAAAEAYFKMADMTPARDCFVAEAYMSTSLEWRVKAATHWAMAANSACTWWELGDWYGSNRLGPDPAKQIESFKKGVAAIDDGYQRPMRARLGELILTGAKVEATPAERVAWIGAAARQRLGVTEWRIASNIAQFESSVPAAPLPWIRNAARYGVPSAMAVIGQAVVKKQIKDISFMDGLALFDLGSRQTSNAASLELQRKQLQPEQRAELEDYEAKWNRVADETGAYYFKEDPLRFDAPVDTQALENLATADNPDAQLRLAFAFEREGQLSKASPLYREVAQNGPARLWLRLADDAAHDGNWPRAVNLYENGAAVGSRKACAEIARIHADGLAGSKDPVQAYVWLLRSESKDTDLLATRKKALDRDQLKRADLLQAQWLLAHKDLWTGDVKAAEALVAANTKR